MTHNARAKATWVDGDVPDHTIFETLDQSGFTAVNGDDGGVWAPSSIIELGGQGISARHVYVTVVGTNADTTYTIASARLICLDNTISADRTYTLGDAGAVNGDVMVILALPALVAARTVIVNDNLGAELMRFHAGATKSAKFIFLGTQWRLLEATRPGLSVVNTGGVGSISTATLSSVPIVDVPGYTASLTCIAGDILVVSMSLEFIIPAADSCRFYTVVVDGGAPTTLADTIYQRDIGAIATSQCHLCTMAYQVVTTGTVTFKGQYAGHASVGGTANPATISLLQLRI